MTINYTTQDGRQGYFETDIQRFIESSNQRQVRQLFKWIVNLADNVQAVTADILGEVIDRLSIAQTDLEIIKANNGRPGEVKRAVALVKRLELAKNLCK